MEVCGGGVGDGGGGGRMVEAAGVLRAAREGSPAARGTSSSSTSPSSAPPSAPPSLQSRLPNYSSVTSPFPLGSAPFQRAFSAFWQYHRHLCWQYHRHRPSLLNLWDLPIKHQEKKKKKKKIQECGREERGRVIMTQNPAVLPP